MSLSIFTSSASMSSMNAMNSANNALTTAMERLGTGKRINSAADDAAGLQIATRLKGQSNGMTVAQRNINDATSLLQTAEGAFDETSNIMYRMKDLATQAANDTNTQDDRNAINSELNDLNDELKNIMSNTSYAGDKLFGASGKFNSALNFQIGSSTDETMTVDLRDKLGQNGSMLDSSGGFSAITGDDSSSYFNSTSTPAPDDTPEVDGTPASGDTPKAGFNITSASGAQALIKNLDKALDDVGSVRSTFGASINRLSHTSANLANMKDNTDLALSNVEDADFATEASTMTRSQMLSQTSMSMLKSANSMSSMVMNLLG